MNGFVFTAPQLAALLALSGARGIPGLSDPALHADDAGLPAALDALAGEGWIVPTGASGQWQVDPVLARVVRVLGAPDYVVRSAAAFEHDGEPVTRAVLHYLAGSLIVELAALDHGRYHLGLIEHRAMLIARAGQVLGLDAPASDALEHLPGLRAEFIVARARNGELRAARKAQANGGNYLAWRKTPQAVATTVVPLTSASLDGVFGEFVAHLEVM
jgi:hypothetical protein